MRHGDFGKWQCNWCGITFDRRYPTEQFCNDDHRVEWWMREQARGAANAYQRQDGGTVPIRNADRAEAHWNGWPKDLIAKTIQLISLSFNVKVDPSEPSIFMDLLEYIYVQAFRHGEKHGREDKA